MPKRGLRTRIGPVKMKKRKRGVMGEIVDEMLDAQIEEEKRDKIKKLRAENAALKAENERLREKGHWTSEPPSEPGWYWAIRKDNTKQAVKVQKSHGELVANIRKHSFSGVAYLPLNRFKLWHTVPIAPPDGPMKARGDG